VTLAPPTVWGGAAVNFAGGSPQPVFVDDNGNPYTVTAFNSAAAGVNHGLTAAWDGSTLTLSGPASAADYEAVIHMVSSGGASRATVSVTVTDLAGNDSTLSGITVNPAASISGASLSLLGADIEDVSYTAANGESVVGGPGNDTFTDSPMGHNTFEGRGGNDTFNLLNGGHDTLLYKLLDMADATGGNGSDTANGFHVGDWEVAPKADRIDLSELLVGYTPAHADGPAHYVNGVSTIDAGDRIGDYLNVTHENGNSVITIDRFGGGDVNHMTALVTLTGVVTDLATLLANHQIVVDHG
jgi:hypothetical protein